MIDHGVRAHATWSASATERNWNCAGALTLASQVAHLEKESEAAAWGTACHQVSEWCLVNGTDADEMIGRIQKTKEHSFEVDEEMAETAQTYVDYVRNRKGSDNPFFIEQRFTLAALKPPFDSGGTADAVVYFPDEKLLEVVDLKGGRGVVVDVNDNKQLRTYAVGAMLANKGLAVDRIRSTIVQPRAPHKDGRIRSEEYDVIDLLEWTSELLEKMQASKTAQTTYATITGDLTREKWADAYLTPGDHCKFCPAAGFCPKLQQKAMAEAGVWFDDLNQPQLSNTPADLSSERLAAVLDAAEMIEDYLKACRALAHSLVDSGVPVGNYILVEKIGRRKFKCDDEDQVKEQIFLLTGLKDEDVYNKPKLRSPAQLEKVLGAKKKGLIAELIETPVTGTNLVRADKTTREAVGSQASQFITPIE